MNKTEKIIGAGIGAAALAALGTYLMYGERGEKNRQLVAGWILKMKGEVLEKVEEIKDLNKEEYYKIVDEVSARYAKLGKVGAGELKHLNGELKKAWEHLSREMN
jgi:gas vesicle protein